MTPPKPGERKAKKNDGRFAVGHRGLVGKNNPSWKGDKAGYVSKHIWVHKHFGKANHCENDKTHKSWRFEWANISGKYLRQRSGWKQLCLKCHVQFDLSSHCRNGHEYTQKNTYYNSKGFRDCRTCKKNQQFRYRQKMKKYMKQKPIKAWALMIQGQFVGDGLWGLDIYPTKEDAVKTRIANHAEKEWDVIEVEIRPIKPRRKR